jgi:signal transduction histidine kinase
VHAFNALMQKTSLQMNEIKSKSLLLKKRNGALKKLNIELDNFVYSTAHDLRSPLTSLLGLLNIIKYENTQPNLSHYFGRMKGSINRMENFIAQIVSYSKNNKVHLENSRVNFGTLINDIVEDHRYIDGAERIQKEIIFVRDAVFVSDEKRLLVIFRNLISNALRYANLAANTPYIKITLDVTEEKAVIEFEDNGVGISKEHINRIFDMFYRANFNSQGSGLGLFIVKETVKKLRGEVNVRSIEGVGTSFLITIPNEVSKPLIQKTNGKPKQLTLGNSAREGLSGH